MKKIKPKEIISKSYKRMTNDFNNFVRIAAVPFIIIAPIYLFTVYYDEVVLDIYNQKGFIAYVRGSGQTKLINWFILFPLTSAFLVNWHRYILFSGKKPWKYFAIDFSKYTFQWIWTSIKVGLIFLVPALAIMFLIGYFLIRYLSLGQFIPLLIIIYSLSFVFYIVRVSLIFPATAAQHDNSFKRTFKMTKNNFWHLFLVLISFIPIALIWFVLFLLIEFTVGTESSVTMLLLSNLLTFAFIFIIYGYLASCLSECYKVLSNK